jgi:putative protease
LCTARCALPTRAAACSGLLQPARPNQGTCTNACRWNYSTQDSAVDPNTGEAIPIKMDSRLQLSTAQDEAEQSFAACGGSPRHPAADKVYLLEEAGRPGQLMPIMEDEHGTYIMNSKDLRAVEHVERLARWAWTR